MQPKVSVLIPTYNCALYLEEAIESVLAQTFSDFELIISDNASTDSTEAIVGKYLSDKRVSYFRQQENLGMAHNWNFCLRQAKGTYIKFLMSDDKFHPQILEKFVAVMEQHPNVALVASDRCLFGKGHQCSTYQTPLRGLQPARTVIYETLNTWNWIGEPTTVMFRRANLHLGAFNPVFKYYLDWDMWLRHLTVGDCYFVPEVLSYFRIHEGQTSEQLKQSYSLYFEEYEFYNYLKLKRPYAITKAGFDPTMQVRKNSKKLFKIGIKLLAKGEIKKWRVAAKALRIGGKEVLLPNLHNLCSLKSLLGKIPLLA